MSQAHRFWILVSAVAISGFSQGMLLPLISIIFEQQGMSSTLNGLHATALYIGIILVSPFLEKPLRRYGYKPMILTGGAIVVIALALFPFYQAVWFWFFLRLIIGIGDNALHFATQTWITSFSSESVRGRNIALYGLFFSLGFAIGPFMTRFLDIGPAFPFILSSLLCLVAWFFLLLLNNEKPEVTSSTGSVDKGFPRVKKLLTLSWVAFLPPFGYGFLESSLHGVYPIYALRIDLHVELIAILLASFSIGGILFQLPLGVISDKIGRRKVLTLISLMGGTIFFIGAFLESQPYLLVGSIFIAGMMLGSTFSMGISYMTDLVPKDFLPLGNVVCGVAFSMGSLTGPILGGMFLAAFPNVSLLVLFAVLFLIIFVSITLFKERDQEQLRAAA